MKTIPAAVAALLLFVSPCFGQTRLVFNKRDLVLPPVEGYRLVVDKDAREFLDEIALGRHPDNDLLAVYVTEDVAAGDVSVRHIAIYSRDAHRDADIATEVWNRDREAADTRYAQIMYSGHEGSRPKHEQCLKTFYNMADLEFSEHRLVKPVLGDETSFSYLYSTRGTGTIRGRAVEFGFFSTATVQYVNKNILLIFAYEVGLPGSLTSERIEALTNRFAHDFKKANHIIY